jgi:hypothetical protein
VIYGFVPKSQKRSFALSQHQFLPSSTATAPEWKIHLGAQGNGEEATAFRPKFSLPL